MVRRGKHWPTTGGKGNLLSIILIMLDSYLLLFSLSFSGHQQAVLILKLSNLL